MVTTETTHRILWPRSRRRKEAEISLNQEAANQKTQRKFSPQRRRDAEELPENALSALLCFSASLRFNSSSSQFVLADKLASKLQTWALNVECWMFDFAVSYA